MAWFRSRPGRSGGKGTRGGKSENGVAGLLLQFAAFVVIGLALASAVEAAPVRIVAFGDSLTAGFELPTAVAFPTVLERRLRADGFDVEVTNAGVSGDTSIGGLARIDWSTPEGTDLVIVELGANDMLRGAPPAETAQALARIVERLQERKIAVVLAGMRSIGNWGDAYAKQFEAIYADLGKRAGVPVYPFFLEGVAGDRELTLRDGMHPNKAGVEKMVAGFAPFLEPILAERFGARARTTN